MKKHNDRDIQEEKRGGYFKVYRRWVNCHLHDFKTYAELKIFLFLVSNVPFSGKKKNVYEYENLKALSKTVKIGKKAVSLALRSMHERGDIRYHPVCRWGFSKIELLLFPFIHPPDAPDKGRDAPDKPQKDGFIRGLTPPLRGPNAPDTGLNAPDTGLNAPDTRHNPNADKGLKVTKTSQDILRMCEEGKHTPFLTDLRGWMEAQHHKKVDIKDLEKWAMNEGYKDLGVLKDSMKRIVDRFPLSRKTKVEAFHGFNNPIDFWVREKELRGIYHTVVKEQRDAIMKEVGPQTEGERVRAKKFKDLASSVAKDKEQEISDEDII